MNIQKYLVQQLCFTIFRVSIYALATVIAFLLVFGTPNFIKQAFVRTNAYKRFVPATISSQLSTNQSTGSMPLSDPNVQKIVQESFPPEILQANMELVINSFYVWLNGNSDRPQFVVDFSPSVDKMSSELSSYAMTRLQALPTCTKNPAEIDPFTATCKPEFFDYRQSQIELADSIKSNNGILSKTRITADDLPKTTAGKTFVDQYSYAPRIFAIVKYAPGILVGTLLTSILVIVALARKKRDAFHWVGVNIASSSVFIVLSPLAYVYIFPRFFAGFSPGSSGGTVAVINDITGKISTEFNNQLIIIGVLLILVGLAIVMLERATRPKSKYLRLSKKAGLVSSETPRTSKGKLRLHSSDVPIQTSEGPKQSNKYQKAKRYRTIHSKEF